MPTWGRGDELCYDKGAVAGRKEEDLIQPGSIRKVPEGEAGLS